MKTQIHIHLFAAALLAVTVAPLHAQLVADGATNTLSNVTNHISGDVIVGTNGSFTLLILSDNALLTNSANGVIGLNATAKSNEVRLVSASARWRMGNTLYVGSNGVANRLVVSNGAFVDNNSGTLGNRIDSSNNVALVTGGGSMWSNRTDLRVGSGGHGNQLIVSNGGRVASRSGFVGNNATGSNNLALVTGSGSVWSNALNVTVGFNGAGNRLVIEAGGLVHGDTGTIGDFSSASNNEALVTGPGSLWTNRSFLTIGNQARGNRLVVSNGASVWSGTGVMGNASTASNNQVLVTGAGSGWRHQKDLTVGNFGPGNQLVVSNGGTVSASNLFVGFNSSATNNRVIVDGGTLRVTNALGTGLLDVRRGTNLLESGLVEVDHFMVTNMTSRFLLHGGTLMARRATHSNQDVFRVGNGVSPATFILVGSGPYSFSQLHVLANGTLRGDATITGSFIMMNGSTLSPGNGSGSIGRLGTSASSPLAGTNIMEIRKSGTALTNDQVVVGGDITFTFGTVIVVTNIGPTPLAAGDRFQLFTAGSFAGITETITLPPLAPGLRWITNLLVDGSIEVESLAPSVQTLPARALTQTSAMLNGKANPNGTATSAWFEWGTTTNYDNVTPPQALGSGTADTNFSEILTGLTAGEIYHFRAVASNSFGVVVGTDQSLPQTFADLVQQAYLKASNTGASDDFGIAVAASGDTVVAGASREQSNATGVNGNQSDNTVDGAGAAYVFIRTGGIWSQQAYLKAADTAGVCSPGGCIGCSCFPGDFFGSSVAVSGDTIVVGAPADDSNATGVNGNAADNSARDSGAAYVFVRNGTTWTQQAYLKASNAEGAANTNVLGDLFGTSVAVSGDTIVVGAPSEDSNATGVNGNQNDNSAPNSGAAYVFVRNGANWTQQAYLKASNTGSADGFGNEVAISGNTIVVGAPSEEGSQGAAYVFVRNGTNWTQQQYLKASNAGFSDFFGGSVGVSDDTVVVGASGEDSSATGVNGNGSNNSGTNSGAAYVFLRSGTNWTQQAYLKASNTEEFPPPGIGDNFGSSVAVSGDRVVIGANRESSNATGVNGDQSDNSELFAGAAYVFVRSGTNWSQQAYVKASNTGGSDSFGTSVSVSGDTVVVGAEAESSNATGVNGNQINNSASFSGAAYVFGPLFPFPPQPTVQTLPTTALTTNSATLNGRAIPNGTATSGWFEWGTTTNYGNVTPAQALGSGTSFTNFSEVLTGLTAGVVHHFRAVASNSLGVVVFGTDQAFGTPSGLITYLKASNTGRRDEFGFAVAMSGDTIVVGAVTEGSNATGVNADQNNNSASDSGAAYVFVRNGNDWIQQAYLKASNTGASDLFGNTVAISGDTIVVGARSEDSNATGVNGNGSDNSAPDAGAAYVFVRNGTNWSQQAYLKASNTGSNDFFGVSVAVSGDTVVVGAQQEDSNASGVNGDGSNNSALDSGAAYVFVRNGTTWSQQAYLKPSNTATGDFFGVAVTVSGDTLMVGSRFEDSIAANSGAAYVFVRNGTTWTQQAQIKAGNASADDEFGRRVALSGDTLVVGASLEDSNATGVNGDGSDNSVTNSGAAYVFVRDGTNWNQQAYLKASNTGPDDNFGLGAVAISGDTMVVAAQLEDSAASVSGDGSDNSATDSGAAYVFMRSGTNWIQQAYLKAFNTEAGDRFGVWVAVSGSTVVVGADLEDSAATGVNGDQSNNSASLAGAVYVYELGQTAPPLLSIAQSDDSQVTLSWTPPTPDFVLQESLNLVPLSWSNSPSGETNPITLPATEQTKFFRLFKP